MKIRILGCGTSTGVPKIGGDWGQCDPNEPRNARLRTSILVESGGQHILVDCGPDLRQQLLAASVGKVDALIATHDHGDHVHGIDEMRVLARANGGPVPLYSDPATIASLRKRFSYAFEQASIYRPILDAREVTEGLAIGAAKLRFAEQPHGDAKSLGMRFEEASASAGYAIDFHDLTDDMASLYEGVDLWIADCLTRDPHPTHAHLDGVLGWARDLRVGRLMLVHMGNGLDYSTLVAELPDWAAPAYDGLEIEL